MVETISGWLDWLFTRQEMSDGLAVYGAAVGALLAAVIALSCFFTYLEVRGKLHFVRVLGLGSFVFFKRGRLQARYVVGLAGCFCIVLACFGFMHFWYFAFVLAVTGLFFPKLK